jgi:hypothetical protein
MAYLSFVDINYFPINDMKIFDFGLKMQWYNVYEKYSSLINNTI